MRLTRNTHLVVHGSDKVAGRKEDRFALGFSVYWFLRLLVLASRQDYWYTSTREYTDIGLT